MKRLTIQDFQNKKTQREKIVALTAYDATFAALIDDCVDMVLVGDSLGMVIQGKENTLDVSLDDMVYHTRAVASRLKKAHLVSDMSFLSYQPSTEKAIESAGQLLKAGAQSVKLEGGREACDIIQALTKWGIPVMSHIGLTPQSVHRFGGFKVQGKNPESFDRLLNDAKAVEEAGAYALVLESIPMALAKKITENSKIPTIGVGAGVHCDGQVLVLYDLLGLHPEFKPKFVKFYANLSEQIRASIHRYAQDVREEKFPSDEYSF